MHIYCIDITLVVVETMSVIWKPVETSVSEELVSHDGLNTGSEADYPWQKKIKIEVTPKRSNLDNKKVKTGKDKLVKVWENAEINSLYNSGPEVKHILYKSKQIKGQFFLKVRTKFWEWVCRLDQLIMALKVIFWWTFRSLIKKKNM